MATAEQVATPEAIAIAYWQAVEFCGDVEQS